MAGSLAVWEEPSEKRRDLGEARYDCRQLLVRRPALWQKAQLLIGIQGWSEGQDQGQADILATADKRALSCSLPSFAIRVVKAKGLEPAGEHVSEARLHERLGHLDHAHVALGPVLPRPVALPARYPRVRLCRTGGAPSLAGGCPTRVASTAPPTLIQFEHRFATNLSLLLEIRPSTRSAMPSSLLCANVLRLTVARASSGLASLKGLPVRTGCVMPKLTTLCWTAA